jgi:hypothetical protein
MEFDFQQLAAFPQCRAVDLLRETVLGMLDLVGLDSEAGSRLPAMFQESGIGLPDRTAVSSSLLPMTSVTDLLRLTYMSYAQKGLAKGYLSQSDIDAFGAALADLPRDPVPFFRPPALVSVFKRKPSS